MTNLTKISILFMLLVSSCNPVGESYEKFTGYVDITETTLPDSAFTGQEVPVKIVATAPNGCWSDITIDIGRSVTADTLFGIAATGLYESYNYLCAEILITRDSTWLFRPDSSGVYIFASFSASQVPEYDTLYVSDSLPGRGRK